MSIKDRIDIEFQKTMEQADELDELSGALCTMGSTGIEDALTLLNKSFKGQNANEYTQKVMRFKDRIYACAEILRGIAMMMRMTARLIYEAEMAAIGFVGVRMY